jgi:hypothetical protein
MGDSDRVAVLIDCDNISSRYAEAILSEVAMHGTVRIKRGYGDWGAPTLSRWREIVPKHAIKPHQQIAHVSGKNATDAALIIDAMDLLYSNTVDVFCIVSSDSDFTSLATRLRESGLRVLGMGETKTHESFQNACDRFTFLEVLISQVDGQAPGPRAEPPTPQSSTAVPPLRAVLEPAISASAKDDGWAPLSSVGGYIVNKLPSFDSRNYGYSKLGALVRQQDFTECKEVPDSHGFSHHWVRLV